MSKTLSVIKRTINESFSGKRLGEGYFKDKDIEDKEMVNNPGMRSTRKPSPPFAGPYKKKPSAKAGKYGIGFSTAKHLAKQGMKSVTKEEADQQVEDELSEVSSELLDRYKTKAKQSADSLTAQGKHKQAGDRWLKVMKATGKQIEKTTSNIKKSLNKEEFVSEDKAGWSSNNGTVKKYEPQKKAPTPHWRFNKDGSHTDMNTGKTHHPDGSVTEDVAEANTPSDAALHKTLGPTKNMQQGVEALKKKHGMSDDEAKKHIRRLMGMKEEAEQIDELSKDMLQRYSQKAKAVSKNAKAYGSHNADPDDSDLADKNWKKHEKLEKGIKKAKDRMSKEEVERVDELNRSTLSSYMAKASDARQHKNMPTAKVDKRYSGVAKASSKLDKMNREESYDFKPKLAALLKARKQ